MLKDTLGAYDAETGIEFSAVNIFEVRASLLQSWPVRRTNLILTVRVEAVIAVVARLGSYNVRTLFLSKMLRLQLFSKVHRREDSPSDLIFFLTCTLQKLLLNQASFVDAYSAVQLIDRGIV